MKRAAYASNIVKCVLLFQQFVDVCSAFLLCQPIFAQNVHRFPKYAAPVRFSLKDSINVIFLVKCTVASAGAQNPVG